MAQNNAECDEQRQFVPMSSPNINTKYSILVAKYVRKAAVTHNDAPANATLLILYLDPNMVEKGASRKRTARVIFLFTRSMIHDLLQRKYFLPGFE